ncbi:SpoIIE family protein phosphatase [bacterium]|nr:SpoIIE family protein phosphatase [bacterium]
MNRAKVIFSKILTGAIFAIGAFLILFLLVFFVREGTKMATYHNRGSIESAITTSADSIYTLGRIETKDFPSQPIPAQGDTVFSINDSLASAELITRYFSSPLDTGFVVPVGYLNNGDSLVTQLVATRPRTIDYVQLTVLQILRTLLAFSFLAVGFWAFLKRSFSAGVRALTLFCYGMATFFTFGVSALPGSYAFFDIPYFEVIRQIFFILAVMFGAFWLNLQLLFPTAKKFIQKHTLLTYSLIYGPYIALLLVEYFDIPVPNQTAFIIISLQIAIGFTILAITHYRTKDSLQRRQTGLVLWGSGVGLVALFLLLIFAVFFGEVLYGFKWTVLLITLVLLPLILSPITFAYAFGRYRLLEIEGKLKRGTRYVAITVLMLALLVGSVYGLGELLIREFGIIDRTPTFVVALALALGFSPAWRRVQSGLERRIYPERHHLRRVISEFLREIISIPDRTAFWERIREQLHKSFGIEVVHPVLKRDDGGYYSFNGSDVELTPFLDGQEITEKLKTAYCPLLIDEALSSGRVVMTTESVKWFENRKVSLLLPLVMQSQLVGFVCLGTKIEQEDYSAEDLEILNSLASQVALASENIRLLEDNIDKKRMEEELKFAQRIQRGFLPREIPETRGLSIAAESQFCLEVAGDYYDVISLPDAKTVMAVGDVSGKGAGAALLMANLQASLRTAVGVTTELSDIVARINDLIYQNTPQEQYITFFVGIYDPDYSILRYVNAGHNPPILVHADGTDEELSEGGLIIGAIPGVPYQQGETRMAAGDTLLIYTDGISEAIDTDEEEFGEDRIRQLLQKCHDLSPAEIIECLKNDALAFAGNKPWEDDMTLLVAKVK